MIGVIALALAAMPQAAATYTCASEVLGKPQGAELRISLAGVEVRPPKHVLPLVHGGTDGWFQLRKTKITDTMITGKVPANLLGNANLLFDRKSLRLTITGAHGDFTGLCVTSGT